MSPVYRFETLDSTSLEASRRAAVGEIGPMWIVATRQSAGRGRSGRCWQSEPGNLYATFLAPLDEEPAEAALYSFVACLGVAEVLDAFVGAPDRISLKWPNDALLDGCKVAGVLLESGSAAGGRWLSVGIGINLSSAPSEARWPAISVADATGAVPGIDVAFEALQTAWTRNVLVHRRDGFAATRASWLARAARLGEQIEARLPSGNVSGRFEGIDGDGTLLLLTTTGVRRVSAADIHFPV